MQGKNKIAQAPSVSLAQLPQPPDPQIVVCVKNLSKVYKLYNSPLDYIKAIINPFGRQFHHEFYALDDMSFEIKKGEMLGIIGKNGSGKSTLLKIVSGVLAPSNGAVTVNGRISALLELGAGFNPELTGIENIFFNGSLLGFTRAEMEAKVDAILAFADIGEFAHQPVKTYSSGMFVRLAFSVATIIEPDILVVDEALSVGDVFFQQRCYKRLEELKQRGTTIIFVTHALGDVVQFCQRALLISKGKIEYDGAPQEAVKRYLLMQQQERLAEFSAEVSQGEDEPGLENTNFYWPSLKDFIDIASIDTVSNDIARCTGVALLDDHGNATNSFYEGDVVNIYCEFVVEKAIEVPVCGFLIKNDKNIMVHGKSTLHYDDIGAPSYVSEYTKIRFKFSVQLSVAPGEYTFDIGLSTLLKKDYINRRLVSISSTQSLALRLCHLSHVARFYVLEKPLFEGVFEHLHTGLCNLPGSASMSLSK